MPHFLQTRPTFIGENLEGKICWQPQGPVCNNLGFIYDPKALKALMSKEMYLPPRPDLLPLELVCCPALDPPPQVHDVQLHIPQSPGLGEPNIRLTSFPGSGAGNVSDDRQIVTIKHTSFPLDLILVKFIPQ